VSDLVAGLLGFAFVASAFLLWVRYEIRRGTDRMWQEALKDPRKMEYIKRFVERGGPPPGI
jgi:hypothetical protein